MEARKLLYTAMALAPAILVACIGVHSRTHVEGYEWPNTSQDQERLNAYIPLVADTAKSLDSPSRANERLALAIADRWVDGQATGKLKQLIPIAADELLPTGVKASVFNAQITVCRRLVEFGQQRAAKGEYEAAARDFKKTIEVANVLKFSNFNQLYRCSLLQLHTTERISKIYPMLPVQQQQEIAGTLLDIRKYNGKLAVMTQHARNVVIEAVRKHESVRKAYEAAARAIPSHSYFEQKAMAQVRPGVVFDIQGPNYTIANQYSNADRCIEIDQALGSKIRQILNPKTSATAKRPSIVADRKDSVFRVDYVR